MRLRNRVKTARRELDISQRELARRTGLSRLTIRAIERDNGYSPNGTVMVRIATALDSDIQTLFWSEREDAA